MKNRNKKREEEYVEVERRRTTSSRRTASGQASRKGDHSNWYTVRWIAGLLIVVAGVIALLSVLSYFFNWEHDYTFANDNIKADDVKNLCGGLGAKLSHYIIYSLGAFGVLVPLAVIVLGVRIIARKSFLLNHTVLAMLIVAILGSLTLGLLFVERWAMFGSGWGGTFGIEVSNILRGYLGSVGSGLVILLGWILSGVFINRNFINTVNSVGSGVIERGGRLVDRVADRAGNMLHPKHDPQSDAAAEQDADSDVAVAGHTSERPIIISADIDEVPQDEEPLPFDPDPAPAAEESAAPAEDGAKQASAIDKIIVTEHEEAQLSDREANRRPFDPDHTPNYKYPSVNLLVDYQSKSIVTDEEIASNRQRIEQTLGDFGIPIREMKATIGPTVTLYEIVQEAGVKIARIKSLEQDIAQSLKALGIRIIAPIPGRGTVGIEVPNINKEIVSMRSAVKSERFQEFGGELPIVIGRTIQNENYVFDLAKLPHLLVAGATGMGKSVGLNAIITSLLYRKDPSQLKFVLIDPKMVEFSLYAKLEKHFLAKMASEEEAIVTDAKKAVYTLNALCLEMDERLQKCRSVGAKNISEYNEKVRGREIDDENIMPYIVVVIDEFADLIMTAKEVEAPVMRLAQKARAIGIHLIIATQRPDVKVITGGIKATFPSRIAFRVMQMIDSRTIIDQPGANQLIGRGDMLLSKDGDLTRIQCALVETKEVADIVDFISRQASPTGRAYDLPDYEDNIGGTASDSGLGSESGQPVKYDALFAEIARDAVASGQISTSYIQRNFEVGFNRAGRIMTQLERAGIVGPQIGAKQREIKFYDMPSLEARLQELGVS